MLHNVDECSLREFAGGLTSRVSLIHRTVFTDSAGLVTSKSNALQLLVTLAKK